MFVLFEKKNTENEVCVRERHFHWWARDREVTREPESGCRARLPCPMAHARRHACAVSCARATAARTAKSPPALKETPEKQQWRRGMARLQEVVVVVVHARHNNVEEPNILNADAAIMNAMVLFVGCSRAEVARAAHRGRIVKCAR